MTGPEPLVDTVPDGKVPNGTVPDGKVPNGTVPGGSPEPRGWALPRAVPLAALGALAEPISEHNGQAVAVRPLTDHPGWLAKLYRPDLPTDDARRMDRLIAAPDALPEADRALLYAGTCWPAARIEEPGNPVVGCVIPMAPEQYRAELRRGAFAERRFVEIDWLAKSDESIRGVGLPSPGFEGRLAACRELTRLAAVLEGLGLVYSDWSFSNAFWSPDRRSVYLIDVDGCRPATMPDIHQPNWADPLTPPGVDADRYTDRYRIGLLAAKCLTGRRGADAFHAVAASHWPNQAAVAEVLLDMLFAIDRERRPSAAQLNQALNSGPYLRAVPRPVRSPLPPLPSRPAPAPSADPVVQPPAGDGPVVPEPPKPGAPSYAGWVCVVVIAVLLIVLLAVNH
ncbi:hypothetical protein [Kitasatospora sp. NBC_01266]|uniref:hypothetical protein n=1 Tax=Kitasatospora sp. NBC_01266 TaxID=2903572 RepID=UPI002E2F336A|nr:hypothetical protein [Kitasatospora sp. NBC_01266]